MTLDLRSLEKALPSPEPHPPTEREEPPLKVKVMLWNIHGQGSARDRNRLVPRVAREVLPDVLLLQEPKTDTLVTNIIRQAGVGGRRYTEVHAGDKTEARVVYDSTQFEAIPPGEGIFPGREGGAAISLVDALEQCLPEEPERRELRGREAGGMRALFMRRIALVGLKRRGGGVRVASRVIVFMSFHNVNTRQGAEVRERGARGFYQIVVAMGELTGAVVVGGADFNQRMGPEYTHILPYEPTPRRRRRVDYFVVHTPSDTTVQSEVIALDFVGAPGDPLNPLNQLMSDLLRPLLEGPGRTIVDYDRALDHDPLLCDLNITFTAQEEED